MTRYEFISIHEYTSGPYEGKRFLKFGKGDPNGADIKIPTPDNDLDEMQRMERQRMMTYRLSEKMTKDELRSNLDGNLPDAIKAELPQWGDDDAE
jgi:hypothetical protein